MKFAGVQAWNQHHFYGNGKQNLLNLMSFLDFCLNIYTNSYLILQQRILHCIDIDSNLFSFSLLQKTQIKKTEKC